MGEAEWTKREAYYINIYLTVVMWYRESLEKMMIKENFKYVNGISKIKTTFPVSTITWFGIFRMPLHL